MKGIQIVVFMLHSAQSQQQGTIVRSTYTDSSCATVPTIETHTQGLCSQLSVPGQAWTTTGACNSTHATLFVYPDGDCHKSVAPQIYPLNSCVSDGTKFAKVTCYPYPENKPFKQVLYADSNCTKPYGTLWLPETNCLINFNPPNQKLVCKPGESAVYFNDINGADCSGTTVKEYVNPCTEPSSGVAGPGIYTRYVCLAPTPAVATSSSSNTFPAPSSTANTMPTSAFSSAAYPPIIAVTSVYPTSTAVTSSLASTSLATFVNSTASTSKNSSSSSAASVYSPSTAVIFSPVPTTLTTFALLFMLWFGS